VDSTDGLTDRRHYDASSQSYRVVSQYDRLKTFHANCNPFSAVKNIASMSSVWHVVTL